MKDISTNVIEIDGKEYTLFLNRKGIVAHEKYCIEEDKKLQDSRVFLTYATGRVLKIGAGLLGIKMPNKM